MTARVSEILSWYRSDNPGTQTNLARMLNHGRLGGSGRMVILPVDQGFEHGPARSFAPNPAGYDPHFHFQLAIDAGCNAYAAPLGFLEAGAADFAGQIPLILKLNNHDVLHSETDPLGAQTGSVEDALRLGCVAIGYTIYPGTVERRMLYEQLRELVLEAKAVGLAVVVWAYPRGGELSKEGESGLDVCAYAAQLAAQLGAHIIKVKLPTMDEVVGAAAVLDYMLKPAHGNKKDVELTVPLELLRKAEETQRMFNLVLAVIASISLLVGGIGIMKVMLATVTERTREIGIRRALGAKKKHIVQQFLVEAGVLSALGGIVGVGLGMVVPLAIEKFFKQNTDILPIHVLLAFSISAAVGVVFGLYPAWRAANMDPVEALRHE